MRVEAEKIRAVIKNYWLLINIEDRYSPFPLTGFRSPFEETLWLEFGVELFVLGVPGFMSFPLLLVTTCFPPPSVFMVGGEDAESLLFELLDEDWTAFCWASLSCFRNLALLFWNHTWEKEKLRLTPTEVQFPFISCLSLPYFFLFFPSLLSTWNLKNF